MNARQFGLLVDPSCGFMREDGRGEGLEAYLCPDEAGTEARCRQILGMRSALQPAFLQHPPIEETEEHWDRLKGSLGLLDIEDDIIRMDLKALRDHFGYQNGNIKRGDFVRNVIWQVYRKTKAGEPPLFVRNGGNVRSLWYHCKPTYRRHRRSFGSPELDGLFSPALTELTSAGLLGYRDLNLIDVNRASRWVAPSYGTTNIILLAEKSAFTSKLIELGQRYGVTVQASGGQSSRVTVDTMLSEMADAGYDLTREFIVYALVDFDPAGWNIATEFVNQLRSLGLKKVREFRPYQMRGAQPWIDMVEVKDLGSEFLAENRFRLNARARRANLTKRWANATGGLYGRGGTDWAISSDEFLEMLDDHLDRKIRPMLRRTPENFQRLSSFDQLAKLSREYLTTRLLGTLG